MFCEVCSVGHKYGKKKVNRTWPGYPPWPLSLSLVRGGYSDENDISAVHVTVMLPKKISTFSRGFVRPPPEVTYTEVSQAPHIVLVLPEEYLI